MEQQTTPNLAQAGAEAAAGAGEGFAPDHSRLNKAVGLIQGELDKTCETIRNDASLHETERHAKIRQIWHRVQEAQSTLLTLYERELEEKSAERERSLFHVPPNMRDSVRSAYNDVYDRTEPAFESGDLGSIEYAHKELERLWERATRTGDRALQQAIGQLAIERGIEELRDTYLASSKEKRQAWERYVEARTKLDHFKSPDGRLWGALTQGFSLRQPPEA